MVLGGHCTGERRHRRDTCIGDARERVRLPADEAAIHIGGGTARRPLRQHEARLGGCADAGLAHAAGQPIERRTAGGFRARTRAGERSLQCAKDELVHAARVAKPHLELLGVRVDIDRGGVQVQVQHISAESPIEQHILVGVPRGSGNELIAHVAPVQKRKLQIGLAAGKSRQRQPSREAQIPGIVAQLDDVRGEFFAAQLGDARQALLMGGRRRQHPHGLAVVHQAEADFEARQRQALQHAQDVLKFGGLAAQEFAARRHIEEQIAHLDAGSRRMRRGRGGAALAVARLHAPGMVRFAGSRTQRQARHGGDARQRFAAKSQGGYALQILKRGDLAGCVARERQPHLLRRDTGAVVAHPDQSAAAALQFHLDAQRARVERILHQLLDHGGRPLDDLAGRDLIDELLGKNLDGQGISSRTGYFRTRRTEDCADRSDGREQMTNRPSRPRRWPAPAGAPRRQVARSAYRQADRNRSTRANPDGWPQRAWPGGPCRAGAAPPRD